MGELLYTLIADPMLWRIFLLHHLPQCHVTPTGFVIYLYNRHCYHHATPAGLAGIHNNAIFMKELARCGRKSFISPKISKD